MSTPDSTSAPTPPAGPKKPRKPRGPLDAATLDQLEKDEEIILAVKEEMSKDATFAGKLAPHFLDAANTIAIDPTSIGDLASQAGAARATAAAAMSGTASHGQITSEEETDKANLLASIQNAQTRAKGKYQQSAPAKLKEYWVGESLNSRSKIEQAAAAIHTLLRTTDDTGKSTTPHDTLPGFDQAAIDLLKTRLDAYTGIQTDQTMAQGDASGARTSLKEQCAQISRRRRKLQLAIDAEYAPGDANSAFRKQFGLQGNKAMS
jgi:hypothetical protein